MQLRGSSSQTSRPTSQLKLQPLRELTLKEPAVNGGGLYLSAASGLVKHGDTFHVVADDSLNLGSFSTEGDGVGEIRKLLNRDSLPADEKARKAVKPDLESLTKVRVGQTEALLSLGSGSTEKRRTGVFVGLSADGKLADPVEFDLSPLYQQLDKTFPELNIEGVAPIGQNLRLLQRGNGSSGPNAVIDLDLERTLDLASQGKPLDASVLKQIKPVDLGTTPGQADDVPWTFTDLAALSDGRAIFTAAAEDTDNPYDDGEILGSALGFLSPDGEVESLSVTDQKVKLEGIAVDQRGDDLVAFLVTDPDDPHKAATLFRADLK